MIESFEIVDAPVSDRVIDTYSPGKRTRQIGKRDNWICGICQLSIDPEYWRSRLGPQFNSLRAHLKPEVEHVVSREWGGSDDDDNLQIAHAACNRHKHTDPQLPVDDARLYLEWKLGLPVDPGPRVPPFWRAPGGSQRVALELAVERDETGPMYFLAAGLRKEDPERSTQLFRRAAELGYVPPKRRWYLVVKTGRRDLVSLFHDNERAALEAAAEDGEPTQMLRLAREVGKDDRERSIQLLHRAVELGDYEAFVDLGVMLREEDPQQSTELFSEAAEHGSLRGMFYLGLTVYPSDKELGLSWVKRAAAESTALRAAHRRSRRQIDPLGRGITLRALLDEFDLERATEVLRELAERDSLEGMYYLGLMLYPSDKGLGLSWLKRATAEGFREASGMLALAEKRGDDFLMTEALSLRNRPVVNTVKGSIRRQAQWLAFPDGRSPRPRDPNVTQGLANEGYERSHKVSNGPRLLLSQLLKRVQRLWR